MEGLGFKKVAEEKLQGFDSFLLSNYDKVDTDYLIRIGKPINIEGFETFVNNDGERYFIIGTKEHTWFNCGKVLTDIVTDWYELMVERDMEVNYETTKAIFAKEPISIRLSKKISKKSGMKYTSVEIL